MTSKNSGIPRIKIKGIKFAHLNIYSLVSKIDELLLKHRLFDVICLNETLCDTSISNDEICIDGFSTVRRDRTRHGGGEAIYVSNDIHFTRRQNLESEALENVWIELKYNKRSPIVVGAAFYRPPSANGDFFDKFEQPQLRTKNVCY